ncbi:MAG: glycosyltransferase family 4 protein, partial [Akkermansiaceae bacterium]|nr:glycosyltransferase family 4 protein [Akkermansiaceae bacterium]
KWVSSARGTNGDGSKRYSIWDAYAHADFVTYPSTYEGFGNAFLEAIYYRKPILCNRYSIFQSDIEPYGFKAIFMNGFLTNQVVGQVRRLLTDRDFCRECVD